MHTIIVVLGVFADILMAIAILSVIVGLVWIAYPLKNNVYADGILYKTLTPMGGRETGVIILASGVLGLVLGYSLDKVHLRYRKRFGARI